MDEIYRLRYFIDGEELSSDEWTRDISISGRELRAAKATARRDLMYYRTYDGKDVHIGSDARVEFVSGNGDNDLASLLISSDHKMLAVQMAKKLGLPYEDGQKRRMWHGALRRLVSWIDI